MTEVQNLSASAQATLARIMSRVAPGSRRNDLVLPANLRAYCEEAWHVLEPSQPFVPNWHLDCISEHLEAVTRGELRNLIINIPPRSGKSFMVSVFWPTWSWTLKPATQWLCASYAESLSVRDAVRSRRLIRSAWYQERYGHLFTLAGDQNVKSRYDNSKSGYRIATSVGGSVTGEGGSIVVADDPHNVRMAESDTFRQAVLSWWDEVMSTRLNDPKTGARVVVMQRVHDKDLTGHLLEKGGYHHLVLPARFEPRVIIEGGIPAPQPHDDCEIYCDPRRTPGELLWPDRQREEDLAQLERDMGPYASSGQLQQRPVPRTGAVFEDGWFLPIPEGFDTSSLLRVMYWDLAFSERQMADYTSAAVIGVDAPGNQYILGVTRMRVAEGNLPLKMSEYIQVMRPAVVGVEVGAYKQQVTHDLINILNLKLTSLGIRSVVMPVKVDQDKVTRAQVPAGRAKAGQIFAYRKAPWWNDFAREILSFPKADHDDQVDAFSGACQMAIDQAFLRSRVNKPRQEYRIGDSPTSVAEWDWASTMPIQVMPSKEYTNGG